MAWAVHPATGDLQPRWPLLSPNVKDKARRAQRKREGGKKKREDLMLVDITRLYYHHFMAPTKLIESAPPPCTESSLLLAGPPSLHFLFFPLRNRTLHIWHTTHSNTHGRRNTLAQLHFHCGSRWQKPHNTCLLVVCACVWACACVCVCGMHARRMRRDEERGGDEFKPFACIM